VSRLFVSENCAGNTNIHTRDPVYTHVNSLEDIHYTNLTRSPIAVAKAKDLDMGSRFLDQLGTLLS